MHIIPAIDILDGQVVRLTQGDYTQVTHYNYTPVELAKQYVSQGATHIHLVDLNGAKDGKLVNGDVFAAIRQAVDVHLDLGGGIRTLATAKQLFDLGINELILGSLLIKDPVTAQTIIRHYPKQISAGLDAKGDHIATEGWEETSALTLSEVITSLNNEPLAHIIYTDIAKDGMMAGPNLEGLATVAGLSTHPVIASGGVSSDADVALLRDIRPALFGCIVGKAVLAGKVTLA